MDLRKQMVLKVRQGELTISGASREYGVSRNTVKLWLRRVDESLVSGLEELCRRPKSSPLQTPSEIETLILKMKEKHPVYGAKKITAKLWPHGDAPVCVRTVDRILSRNGLVSTQERQTKKALQRFERGAANELWQMDFKGLGPKPPGYSPLSVLDDAIRFCLTFEPLPDHRSQTIWEALWETFGEYGVPDAILSDNEPCFADKSCKGPSWLEAKLWLLGIRTLHGRPRHPQTQGKVERFHQTVQRELGPELRQPTIADARIRYARYVREYNYDRPHEAIGQRVPGAVYTPSIKKRPKHFPVHEIPAGATARKVDPSGKFTFKGQSYRAGAGLAGEYVVIEEAKAGLQVKYATRPFALLTDLIV